MTIDGRSLSKAREALNRRKTDSARELERRRQAVESRVPEVLETERKLRALMADVIGAALRCGEDTSAAIDRAEHRNLELQARRAELLVGAGFPIDYIDERYLCDDCRDTGYVEAEMCSCLRELYNREMKAELSNLLKLGEENFDTFDLSYYSTSAENGVSPRDTMTIILETCRRYANRFGSNSDNLLFQGGTGLGKTFLSACIARVVSDRGFSVVYDRAVSVLEAFETQRFSRDSEQGDAASAQIRRYLNCDLLIIDDLGTEPSSSFVGSALYTVINSRLTAGKKTIISTNLTSKELSRRYMSQIVSRLEGEYLNLRFAGNDIRAIKKERGLNA